MLKKFDDMFSPFDKVHECERRTEERTDIFLAAQHHAVKTLKQK